MKKIYIVLLVVILLLSTYICITQEELRNSKEQSELLSNQLESNKKVMDEFENRVLSIESEIETLKDFYKVEAESRNLIDLKVRKIYDAIVDHNIEIIREEVTSKVEIDNDQIIFENGYIYDLIDRNQDFTLRQRYFQLDENRKEFWTAYELLENGLEFVPVYNFKFILENGEWKLSDIYEE